MSRAQLIAIVVFAVLARLTAGSVAAAERSDGVDVRFVLRDDTAQVLASLYFPPRIALPEVREALTDLRLATLVSNLVTDIQASPADPTGLFRLDTTASKYLLSRTTRSLCMDSLTPDSWMRRCRLDPSERVNQSTFTDASGTSLVECTGASSADEGPRCEVTLESRPAPMRFPLPRSPQRLAAAGAVESVHDLATLHIVVVNRVGASEAKRRYSKSPLAKHMQRMFDDTLKLQSAGQLRGRRFEFAASSRTGGYSRTLTNGAP